MNVEVQADNTGTLRFVAPDKGTIAALSYQELSILYSLSRMAKLASLMAAGAQEQDPITMLDPVTVHLGTRTIKAGKAGSSAKDLLPCVRHLQDLQLVSTSRRRQAPGLVMMWPYSPMNITPQGRLLMRWLKREWVGWPAYARRFPL